MAKEALNAYFLNGNVANWRNENRPTDGMKFRNNLITLKIAANFVVWAIIETESQMKYSKIILKRQD